MRREEEGRECEVCGPRYLGEVLVRDSGSGSGEEDGPTNREREQPCSSLGFC